MSAGSSIVLDQVRSDLKARAIELKECGQLSVRKKSRRSVMIACGSSQAP